MRTLSVATLLAFLSSNLAAAAATADGACLDASPAALAALDAVSLAASVPPPPFAKLAFERAGWDEQVVEPVFAGSITQLAIDPNRFPGCETGNVTGFVRDAAGAITEIPMDTLVNGRWTGNFVAPAGRFDVWFRSERPEIEGQPACRAWDSNLGANYAFASKKYEPARVTFGDAWPPAVDGALVAGGALVIEYDADRLAACRTSYLGNPTWSILAHVRFDDGRTVSKNVAGTIPTAGGPAAFAIPEGAKSADVWFENVGYYPGNTNPCRAWDSRYGQNYRLPIGP